MNFLGILIGFIINVLVSWLGGFSNKVLEENLGANIVILIVMLIIVGFSGYFTASKAQKRSLLSVFVMGFCSDLFIAVSNEPQMDEFTGSYCLFLIMIIPMTITGWFIFDVREKHDEQEADENIDWVYREEPKKNNIMNIIKAIVAAVFFIPAVILLISNSLNVYEVSIFDALSRISGRVLMPFIFTVIIYKVFKKRKRSILFPAITFFIIVIVTVIGSAQSEWKRSDLEAYTNYQKSFIQDVLEDKEITHQTFDEETYGKAAMVLEIHNDYMINALDILKKATQEIEEQNLNIDKMLSQKILTNKKRIEEYNAKYANVFRIIDKAESDFKQNNIKLEEALVSVKAPSEIKKGLFIDCPPQNVINLRKIFTAQQKIFQYAVNNKDQYTFEDNEISFYKQKNEDKFNSIIDEYNNAIDESTAIEEVLLNKAKEIMKE